MRSAAQLFLVYFRMNVVVLVLVVKETPEAMFLFRLVATFVFQLVATAVKYHHFQYYIQNSVCDQLYSTMYLNVMWELNWCQKSGIEVRCGVTSVVVSEFNNM